jgi:hypothetical protein
VRGKAKKGRGYPPFPALPARLVAAPKISFAYRFRPLFWRKWLQFNSFEEKRMRFTMLMTCISAAESHRAKTAQKLRRIRAGSG